MLIIRRSRLYYTASGIITPIGGRPVHSLREESLLSTQHDSIFRSIGPTPSQLYICSIRRTPSQLYICSIRRTPSQLYICSIRRTPLQLYICSIRRTPSQLYICSIRRTPSQLYVCSIRRTPSQLYVCSIRRTPSKLYIYSLRRTPIQLHSQQHISTQHDMLSQHPVYKNKLNCECYNITLVRKNIVPWWWSKNIETCRSVLSVLIAFMWNLCKCNCWLIIEVILQNARCNNKIYTLHPFTLDFPVVYDNASPKTAIQLMSLFRRRNIQGLNFVLKSVHPDYSTFSSSSPDMCCDGRTDTGQSCLCLHLWEFVFCSSSVPTSWQKVTNYIVDGWR